MTLGGITSSLNLTLSRLNSIESNFSALDSLGVIEFDIPKTSETAQNQKSEFQNILDSKTEEKQKIEDKVLETPLITNEIDKDSIKDESKIELLEKLKTEAINLKSKMDLKAQSANIDEIIETFSNKYNIDGDFIKAIINQESGFNPKATSKKGAMGLMQLMPKTAESLGIKDAYNPYQNIEGGVKYLKGLMDKYNNNPELALAAYNAGSGAVQKYGGIPPYKETQNYVKSIMSAYNKTKGVNL